MLKEKIEQAVMQMEATLAGVKGFQADLEIEVKASYDVGFTDGAASIGSNVIYTQEEMDSAVAAAVSPLKEQITSLSAELESVKAGIPAQVEAALVELKASLKAAYEAQQAGESESESQILELLK